MYVCMYVCTSLIAKSLISQNISILNFNYIESKYHQLYALYWVTCDRGV